ncbi:DUF4934 domain-containing protein [Bacteroides sp. OttesenSCG-928-D19]|nr:DUF4934 domain-containing protein [Bacteroides sp. OttesenSCG-928-N06]MDL2305855.1 DUF4934 domain-containing protein [Bacteroides sp. OttesenSCG-928-D19]
MKKHFLLALAAVCLATACTEQPKEATTANEINVAEGLENLTTLKTSDFGSSIRYIPLETTDDCLIGNRPTIEVLKKHIVVTTRTQCLLFNKEDGKFICPIGHIGEDPEGYSGTLHWVNESETELYFKRRPSQLIRYNIQGNFAGKLDFGEATGLASSYLITDSMLVGYHNELLIADKSALTLFHTDATAKDSIAALLTPDGQTMNNINSINVLKDLLAYGKWNESGVGMVTYKDGGKSIIAPSTSALWRNNGEIRFKENFIDTVYTLKNNRLIPYVSFHTGSWHWPENERTNTENNNKRLTVSYVAENNQVLFFQCIQGLLLPGESILYNGVYNKETGISKMAKGKDAIEDDLTHFLPFTPRTVSSNGEYAGLLEAPEILEWAEENDKTGRNKQLDFIHNLTEEMNPVVVLVF